jgi:hypothetical protein
MNAQREWKIYYRKAQRCKLEGDEVNHFNLLAASRGFRREAALERIISRLTRENQAASEIIEGAYVVLGYGDFKNGVTDPSGHIDEGEVYAGRQFEQMRQWLLTHPTKQNYIKSECAAA